MKIINNTLQYNGFLSKSDISNHPDSVELEKGQLFPYEKYSFRIKQEYGVFGFFFNRHKIAKGEFHNIEGNTFKQIFCDKGCAYYAEGDKF